MYTWRTSNWDLLRTFWAEKMYAWLAVPVSLATGWGLSRYITEIVGNLHSLGHYKDSDFQEMDAQFWKMGCLVTGMVCVVLVVYVATQFIFGHEEKSRWGLGENSGSGEKTAQDGKLTKGGCEEKSEWAMVRRDSMDVVSVPTVDRVLLPRQSLVNKKALTVVMDLDETLISAGSKDLMPPNLQEVLDSQMLVSKEVVCAHKNSAMTMVVVLRPGVQRFLERVSRFAEIVLYTAGAESYADPLIDCLDPDRTIFSARLFRGSTVKSRYQEYVKDLSMLGRDLRKTVLLDDRPFSGLMHPFNVIPCSPFVGDPRDHGLLTAFYPLLEHLGGMQDVRPVLKDTFRMHEYMVQCGVPMSYVQKCLDSPYNTKGVRLG